ncbi:MAG TPA: ABC transporter permease, partial [Methylomirabilota bacterium]|nr:ABC transporter permease [Methylomirabilota bacterium]
MTAGSLRFLGGRLLLALLSLWGVSVLAFAILRILPGDPALLMAPVGSTTQDLERFRAEFGLAGSWWSQYGVFLADLVRGRFGRSLWLQQDALGVILARLPATLELALAALVLSVAGGIGLGVLSVWRRRSALEFVVVGLGTLGIAVPNFVWGLLFIVAFGALLRLLPVSGRVAPELEFEGVTGSAVVDALLGGDGATVASVLRHLLLPASALALPLLAAVFRTVRSDLLTALGEEYVVTERMKGLGEARILCWRVLKNALIPTLTLVGV